MTALENIKAALEAGPTTFTVVAKAMHIASTLAGNVARSDVHASESCSAALRSLLSDELQKRDSAVRELLAYVESLETKVQTAEKALNQCASWNEGPEVGSHFDEPGAASIAREYFAAMEHTNA